MRILSISAQKPDSTGSGIYMTELVKALLKEGHKEAVIAGITREDRISLPEEVGFYPVYFESKELPFPVVGMSDEMPYRSTRYRDMTEDMTESFIKAFSERAVEVSELFKPDLILCHHLYLMTSAVRRVLPEKKIYGFCHNTDLRQMQKTDLMRDYIREGIRELDRIFVVEKEQTEIIKDIYGVTEDRISCVGTGYNSSVFRDMKLRKDDDKIRLIFAGKISEKKGVKSLLRCIDSADSHGKDMELLLAGGAGDEREYEEIKELAENCRTQVRFLGKLSQNELSRYYNICDIFVLPTYFDSIPLTLIEAMACGLRVVISELPGLVPWIEENVPGADVLYVPMPEMKNTDEPLESSLPTFERRLSEAISISCGKKHTEKPDLSRVSWSSVAKKVLI